MADDVDVRVYDRMLAGGFRLHPAGHRHLRGALFDSVIDLVVKPHQILQIFRADQTARALVDHHPGTGGSHQAVAQGILQVEITEIEKAVRPLVPGEQRDIVAPLRRVGEMEMHPGKHPGDVMDVQVVIAETQLLGRPIGDFLRHVHEGRRL